MAKFLPIRSYDNYVNANLQLGLLQEAGIDCHLKDEFTVTIDPLLSPALGGIKLMVEEMQAARAEQVLDEVYNNFLETITCPVCGKTGLVYLKHVTHYTDWWNKIKSLLINGQAEEVRKYYQCTHCKSTFNEIPEES